MSGPWTDWDHVLKVDPDKDLPDGVSYADVCQTGTDAIEIGGTLGMTREKIRDVVAACQEHGVPLYQEPSNPAVVIDDESLDGYLVPIVLNAGDTAWITGFHKEWIRLNEVDWSRTFTEAYIVLNPDCSAAEVTGADTELDPDDVGAYAELAEQALGQPICYVEYSGTFGEEEMVAAAAAALEETTLFYGGGIDDYESARRMGHHADTIVVGDLVHDNGPDAVRATVEGVRDAHAELEAS
ncbi:MAG: phosphoglycerol geranylgeranyltransferase [Halobacteriaceae archaeon]